MFMSRFFPGGHLTSGRIPERGQQGALPVPPLIVAPSGGAVWGSAATPTSGSGPGVITSGPPHPPPPLVPVPDNNHIDDGISKRRLPFPVPPAAGFYISDLLYRGGGVWALRRGASSPTCPPGVVVAARRASAPASPGQEARRERCPGSPVQGGEDAGGDGTTTTTTSGTTSTSHKLKFGIDRILAKDAPKPARSPTAQDTPCPTCPSLPASPYLLPGTDPLLPRLHTHPSRVLDLHHLHQHHHQQQQQQQHQHPGQHHHQHHRPRPHQHQHQQQHHQGGPYLYRSADFPGPYSVLACDGSSPHQHHQPSQNPPGHPAGTGSGGKRKRSWSRAVFSHLQRKGLEKRFEVQKYVTKPDRRQLAGLLNLTDAQVKVWFQNRRMKWRHAEEAKRKKDDSQLSQEQLRGGSERGEQGETSDSDIEVTDSPGNL